MLFYSNQPKESSSRGPLPDSLADRHTVGSMTAACLSLYNQKMLIINYWAPLKTSSSPRAPYSAPSSQWSHFD